MIQPIVTAAASLWMPSAEPPFSITWYEEVPSILALSATRSQDVYTRELADSAVITSTRQPVWTSEFSKDSRIRPGIRLKSPMSTTGVPCANLPNLWNRYVSSWKQMNKDEQTWRKMNRDELRRTEMNRLSQAPRHQQAGMNIQCSNFLSSSLDSLDWLKVLNHGTSTGTHCFTRKYGAFLPNKNSIQFWILTGESWKTMSIMKFMKLVMMMVKTMTIS